MALANKKWGVSYETDGQFKVMHFNTKAQAESAAKQLKSYGIAKKIKVFASKLSNPTLKTPKGGFIKCRGVRIRAGKLEILK